MKKSIIFILVAITSCQIWCQIKVLEPIIKPGQKLPVAELRYDSLQNINKDNVLAHKGQTVYIKGSRSSKTMYFHTEKTFNEYSSSNVYCPINPEKGYGGSKPDSLLGNYYHISMVHRGSSKYWPEYCLELVNPKNNSIIYYPATGLHPDLDIFITVGFYEKLEQLYLNQTFYKFNDHKFQFLDSDKEISIPDKTRFTCTDVVVGPPADPEIFLILDNESIGQIKVYVTTTGRLSYTINAYTSTTRIFRDIVLISTYDNIIKKYGARFGENIARGKVILGMNQDMVRTAWGEPKEIRTSRDGSGSHAFWDYGYSSLHFVNNSLKSIDN